MTLGDGVDRATELTPGTSANEPDATNATWRRLEDQLGWYERKSGVAQHWYKGLRILQLVLSVSIPVVVTFDVPAVVTAILGGTIAVLEGIQQLFQFHEHWILYRSTAESLKHQRYLYLAHARPYSGRDRDRVLAEQVEGLVSQEHARWTSAHPKDEPEAEA